MISPANKRGSSPHSARTTSGTTQEPSAPLASWEEGDARQAIVDFVAAVATPGSSDFVRAAERIAVFDNDGTLWAEQPMYFQAFFVFERIRAMAREHPEWSGLDPFAAVLAGDYKGALAGGEHGLIQMAMATHTGMDTEEFESVVSEWIGSAKHPATGSAFTDMIYQPMLELLAYLRENGFKTYIVSGGGIEFMRVFSERVYGIPPEQVIGSSVETRLELREGTPVLVKLPQIHHFDDKGGKPVAINNYIGRRPIAAFGNSDGDLDMLRWTAAGTGRRLAAFIHHTDDEREWSYDRTSSIGRLDKGLDEARDRRWTVVDIKRDWRRVFPSQPWRCVS